MKGLGGVRVIVVDDKEDEALPILKDLAQRGIPSAFFLGGSKAPVPVRQNPGIRLAILDMDLGWIGATEAGKASSLAKFISNIFSPENGPYGILAWTSYPEIVEHLKKYLYAETSFPRPIFTLCLTKDECSIKGKISAKLLSEKLDPRLADFTPLMLMETWEEQSFCAATEVTNTLSKMADCDAPDLDSWSTAWNKNFLNLMNILAKAEMEQNLDLNNCLSGFYNILNPLHADKMETKSATLVKTHKKKAKEIIAADGKNDLNQNANLNTMLHLGFEQLNQYSPGNLYILSKAKIPPELAKIDGILTELFIPVKDKTGKVKQEETEILFTKMKTQIKLIALEISAACDYAQKHIYLARFLGGILIPETLIKHIRHNDLFLNNFGPICLNIEGSPSVYYVCLSARHFVTLDIEKAQKLRAVAKIRSQALAVLQDWFAQHAGRPGMVWIGTK